MGPLPEIQEPTPPEPPPEPPDKVAVVAVLKSRLVRELLLKECAFR